jgi:cardiolipin synthase
LNNNTSWKFYLNSADAWLAMKEACINARKTIDIEQFILETDDIASEFLEILINKRKAGVRVRILCDMAGSYNLFLSSLPAALRDGGVELRFWNVVKPWRIHTFFSWFFRDHRKLMVIDKDISFIGGVGIRDDFRGWRDTHLKLIGPITEEVKGAFDEMWRAAGERSFFRRWKQTKIFSKGFSFLTNSPFPRKRFFYQALIEALRSAQKKILITTPYFLPDRRIRRVLSLARRRGVEVIVLVPKKSNHALADIASHAYYEKLLEAGVKMFHYTDGMIHAKTVIVDDSWATVGSFNLDSLSILYNYEANVISTKKEFVEEIETYWGNDLVSAEEVTLAIWRNRSSIRRFREFITFPIRRFL